MSRRTMEKTANEAINQIALTGHAPKDSLVDALAANADVSIDMLSRMGDPDDRRQQKACVSLIDNITAYCLTDKGRRYVDLARNGLKKAIDRSDDTDLRLHLLDQLKTCAKPADAAHMTMYLSDPDMAPATFRLLVDMPGIDGVLASAATASPDDNLAKVIKAREGQTVAAPAEKARPKSSAIPFWTTSLDKAVERMAAAAGVQADDIVTREPAAKAMPQLLALAAKTGDDAERDALLARYVTLADRCGAADGERYLLLREADAMNPCADLRNKIITALGGTHTVQALAYIRQYYDKAPTADAVAAATHDIIAAAPQLNGGRHVRNMLVAAKQSFIRHYDEQGVDTAIDDVLDAIDHCGTAGGYNLATGADTKMGKRGYWNMYDELRDFDLAFDWLAEGTLTVSLHSMPVLSLNRRLGARLAGDTRWHPFGGDGKSYRSADDNDTWCTASISVTGGKVTVTVNGHDLFVGTPLVSDQPGEQPNAAGVVRFLADDDGATIRQVCIRRR